MGRQCILGYHHRAWQFYGSISLIYLRVWFWYAWGTRGSTIFDIGHRLVKMCANSSVLDFTHRSSVCQLMASLVISIKRQLLVNYSVYWIDRSREQQIWRIRYLQGYATGYVRIEATVFNSMRAMCESNLRPRVWPSVYKPTSQLCILSANREQTITWAYGNSLRCLLPVPLTSVC